MEQHWNILFSVSDCMGLSKIVSDNDTPDTKRVALVLRELVNQQITQRIYLN